MKLNGTSKLVGTLVSSLLIIIVLIFATMRHTQSQMINFRNDYSKRLRAVEQGIIEIKGDSKHIREIVQRIENKLD